MWSALARIFGKKRSKSATDPGRYGEDKTDKTKKTGKSNLADSSNTTEDRTLSRDTTPENTTVANNGSVDGRPEEPAVAGPDRISTDKKQLSPKNSPKEAKGQLTKKAVRSPTQSMVKKDPSIKKMDSFKAFRAASMRDMSAAKKKLDEDKLNKEAEQNAVKKKKKKYDDVRKEIIVVNSPEDLPTDIKKKLKAAKINEELMAKHFDVLLHVLSFTIKEKDFVCPSVPKVESKYRKRDQIPQVFISPGKAFRKESFKRGAAITTSNGHLPGPTQFAAEAKSQKADATNDTEQNQQDKEQDPNAPQGNGKDAENDVEQELERKSPHHKRQPSDEKSLGSEKRLSDNMLPEADLLSASAPLPTIYELTSDGRASRGPSPTPVEPKLPSIVEHPSRESPVHLEAEVGLSPALSAPDIITQKSLVASANQQPKAYSATAGNDSPIQRVAALGHSSQSSRNEYDGVVVLDIGPKDAQQQAASPSPSTVTGSTGGSSAQTPLTPENMPSYLKQAAEVLFARGNPKDMYNHLEYAGKGGFGRVFVAKNKSKHSGDEKVAVKLMPHTTEKEIRMNLNEIAFMKFCIHPNIVRYITSFMLKEEVWLVMEFMEGGTLSEAVRACRFSEAQVAYTAKQMLKALEFLHDNKIGHRDLKSSNVMLSIHGEVKIIDFGLCEDFNLNDYQLHMCGSPFWMPPEMILQKPHNWMADIWSFAVCMIEMLQQHVPRRKNKIKAMFYAATQGIQVKHPEDYSTDCKDFLSSCLQIDPTKRPTAKELSQHPFLKKAESTKAIQKLLTHVFLCNSLHATGFY